jgi:hypothetical protein
LLRSLTGDTLPPFYTLLRGFGEMRLGALRNYRNDSPGAELYALFDGPLHAVKFEDGQVKSQVGLFRGWDDVAQVELDPVICDAGDATAADAVTRSDIKFLPDTSAQGLRQVPGMCTHQGGAIAGDFVGDPAAAGHGKMDSKAKT